MNTPINNQATVTDCKAKDVIHSPCTLYALPEMQPITLEEMANIRLMDRVDTKFVAPIALLPHLLEEMSPLFKVQVIDDKRIANYATQYFDTEDLDFFTMHQNGKLNRQKIRIRSYTDSNLSFLEIKNKNNKGRTSKKRVPVALSHVASVAELQNEKQQFLNEHSLFAIDNLFPALENNFRRMTFVNSKATERITIDTDLSFRNYKTGSDCLLDNLMILELKQDGWQGSDFREILLRLRVKPLSFSKYCMGTYLTNPDVKHCRLKRKWTIINKLTQ